MLSACASPPSFDETRSGLHDATTVIALTFDDTLADQFQVGEMAAARGMRATFYVNSSRLGAPGYMTAEQLVTLQRQGHEIGGHTLSHARLTAVTADEARRQVCDDRAALLDAGFTVTSFAYPFGANDATAEQIVEDCGYNSARDVGGLRCTSCPAAESIPPADPYVVRTNDSIDPSTTLAMMQQQVLDAEQSGGGFVPIVFHHVCDGCAGNAVSPQTLASFLDWLAARAPATQVATVHEVIGGPVLAPVRFLSPRTNLLQNASLEVDANGDQVPDCWQRGGFGTNTATFELVDDAFDGDVAQRITMTSWSSGARRLVTAQDSGACAPAVTPGRSYTMTAYYTATAQPRFTVYYRDPNGAWVWFAQSPLLPTSSSYVQASYTTPPLPAEATAISLGLSLYDAGTLTMDHYTLVDASAEPPPPPPPDTTPPSLSIACNGTTCAASAYASAVTVRLTAFDDASGLHELRYTTDGSDPATGTPYAGPFTVSASSVVRATAVDGAGNRTAQSASITIEQAPGDTTPPALAIACDGSPCATTPYPGPVQVSLAASDPSGIAEVRYTTDGSDPATGTPYTAPFTVSASATVRATAVDSAGNRASQSASITIEGDEPPPPPPANLLQNASLEVDADADEVPDCWKQSGYGTNTATFTLTSDAFDGTVAQRLDITSWSSGGRRLVSGQDAGACAPSASPGRSYTMTGYYKATVQPRFSVYIRDTTGAWRWFAESAPLPASATYRQATYTSPPLPSDATAIAVGLSIFGVGSITTDAYTLVDAAAEPPPDTTPPTLAIACDGSPCATTPYPGPVQVSLTASDPSGIAEVRYTTDGSDPATGTPYTAPFTVSTSATVRATAVDSAGNRASQSASITIEGDEPPPPAPPANLLQNASLEVDADGNEVPDCWKQSGYGTNTATFTLTSDAFDGTVAQRLDITSWSSGGRRLVSGQDAGACAPSASPGRSYTMTGYYKATVQPRFSVYIRDTTGAWRWFAESAPLPASATYQQATYTSPPLPSDATAIAVGLSIFGVGSITTDAYTLVEAPP